MISGLPGVIGAAFLDQEGEAVVTTGVKPEAGAYEMKVIGAYAGIFLSNVRRICQSLKHGSAHRFKLQCENSTLLVSDLRDGYYVVLVIDNPALESMAWERLLIARDRLIEEL